MVYVLWGLGTHDLISNKLICVIGTVDFEGVALGYDSNDFNCWL